MLPEVPKTRKTHVKMWSLNWPIDDTFFLWKLANFPIFDLKPA